MVCTFGMVEIFVPTDVHVPRPEAGIIETKFALLCIMISSLLTVVPPLTDGEFAESARPFVWPTKLD